MSDFEKESLDEVKYVLKQKHKRTVPENFSDRDLLKFLQAYQF